MSLTSFYNRVKERFSGSLVRVKDLSKEEPNAKEYLSRLAKEGSVERVKWGWYWIPCEIKDVWEFLEKDKNFKVVAGQTAASLWNGDFVHRDIYRLRVKDKSFGRALEEFGKRKGWKFFVEYNPSASYKKLNNLLVEDMEESVIQCIQSWAFLDAFAILYSNQDSVDVEEILKRSYWQRIANSNIRVRQAIRYGCYLINKLKGEEIFKTRKTRLRDSYLRREIEEAVERVIDLG